MQRFFPSARRAIADGGIAVVASVRYRSRSALWWIALIEGLCGVVARSFPVRGGP